MTAKGITGLIPLVNELDLMVLKVDTTYARYYGKTINTLQSSHAKCYSLIQPCVMAWIILVMSLHCKSHKINTSITSAQVGEKGDVEWGCSEVE